MKRTYSKKKKENIVIQKEKHSKTYLFFYGIVKRLFDIACSLIGCILLIPLMIIIKIINLIHKDYKSIFYSHTRIGKNGKPFKLYKFRSMVPNADEVLKELLKDKKYADEWNQYQKFENDPRITKIGKILRKTSLDETPQFLNVLLGHMSLIGPRPLVPGELEKHMGNPSIYNKIRPGLTSWWACNGRSATNYKERLDLEYYYVLNRSFGLDIKCIFQTIKVVLNKKGAR